MSQTCDAGKFRGTAGAKVTGDCSACTAGTYSAAGSSACLNCAAGKYLAQASGKTGASCTDCGFNAQSPAASGVHTACQCNAGYYGAALTFDGTSMTCNVSTTPHPWLVRMSVFAMACAAWLLHCRLPSMLVS